MDLNWLLNHAFEILFGTSAAGLAFGPELWTKIKAWWNNRKTVVAPASLSATGTRSELWEAVRNRYAEVGATEAVKAMDAALSLYLVGPAKTEPAA